MCRITNYYFRKRTRLAPYRSGLSGVEFDGTDPLLLCNNPSLISRFFSVLSLPIALFWSAKVMSGLTMQIGGGCTVGNAFPSVTIGRLDFRQYTSSLSDLTADMR